MALKKNSFELEVPNWGLEIKFRTYRKENQSQEYLDFSIEGTDGNDTKLMPQICIPKMRRLWFMVRSRLVYGILTYIGVLGQTYVSNGEPLEQVTCNKNRQGVSRSFTI